MLKKIRLTDFKSFVDEEVELAPLTLLVGANASGKSNFLDAIRFLQGLSFDLTLAEVLNGKGGRRPDAWTGIRGRAEEVAHLERTRFALDSSWIGRNPVHQPIEIKHRIHCRTRPIPEIESESLSSCTGELLFERQETSLRDLTRSKTLQIQRDRERSLLSEGSEDLRLSLFNSPGHTHLSALGNALQQIRLLKIQPARMRDYGRRDEPFGNDGRNLSGVLAEIYSGETKESLIAWLSELCAPDLEDIELVDVPQLGDVMAIFVERGGRRISARSISDGTLRFLGTLLALRTAHAGEVILIEEIDSGLHPTRIRILVELLESVVQQREVQVIATTHSPVVLQWLSVEALRNVIVFGRVPDHEGTIMRRLGDLPHFDEVVQRKGIEELFTTGWLEMAL